MAKKIGFLLYSGPNGQDATTVAGLADAALKQGLEVEIFVMYEGVMLANDKRFTDLAQKGAKITACAHNANELQVPKSDVFNYGSQYDNSNIVFDCDKYIAFT